MPTAAQVVQRPYFEVVVAGSLAGTVLEGHLDEGEGYEAQLFRHPNTRRVFDTYAQAVAWLTQLHRARERAFAIRERLHAAELAIKKLEMSE